MKQQRLRNQSKPLLFLSIVTIKATSKLNYFIDFKEISNTSGVKGLIGPPPFSP